VRENYVYSSIVACGHTYSSVAVYADTYIADTYTVVPCQATESEREVRCMSITEDAGRDGAPVLNTTAAYVSIRQHTSACVSICQHTSAYVSIRQHTAAYGITEAIGV